MCIQAVAAVTRPSRQVHLPNAFERKLINILGGILPPMVLVGPDILQVKKNAAVCALGHARHEFAIRQFIPACMQITTPTFNGNRDGNARRQGTNGRDGSLDSSQSLTRWQQKTRVPRVGIFTHTIEAQVFTDPWRSELHSDLAQHFEARRKWRMRSPDGQTDTMNQFRSWPSLKTQQHRLIDRRR